MYDVNKTAHLIKLLAKQKQISTGIMLAELGISKNALSSMTSRGSWINVETLARISDYLDCSIDYLMGRTDVPEMNVGNTFNVNNSPQSVQGYSNNVTFAAKKQQNDSLVDEMIAKFNGLPFSSKVNVLNMIEQESAKNEQA